MTDPAGDGGLRNQILRGARLLFMRQAIGLLLSVGGILVLTRLIGPAAYGVYATAFGILFFAQTVGEFSLDVYIVRYAGNLTRVVCHQLFSLLLLFALVTTVALLALARPIAALVDLPEFLPVALVMFSSVPVMHLQQVPLSRLERRLAYAQVGIVEVSGQVAFVGVALGAAAAGAGVWAPVVGWWCQQTLLLVGFWAYDDYRPRLQWSAVEARAALAFGLPATSSTGAFAVRNLVPPLLVASTLGAAAVGYVALAVRIVQQLGIAGTVIQRMAIAVVAKVADDRDRLRTALTEATEVQVLAVGLPLAGFALLADVLVPLVFGEQWRPVSGLMPLLVAPMIAVAVFNVQNAVMQTRSRPWDLVVSQGASSALLWLAALLLLDPLGLPGYGVAELIAMASWAITDRLLVRRFPRPNYQLAGPWWLAVSGVALAPVTTWWFALAAVVFAMPASVRRLREISGMLLRRSAPVA